MIWWALVTGLCGAYVFVGIWMIGLSTLTGNWMLIGLALVGYALSLALLSYARKKPW